MKEDLYDDLFNEKEEKTDFLALFFKYYIHWQWFVVSIVICLLGAWFYLRYTTPVYNISATVLIKDDKKGGAAPGNLSAFEDLGILSTSKNIDNETEILQSKSLIKDVVTELNLYTSYLNKGTFNDVDIYNASPINVYLSPQEADQLNGSVNMQLTLHTNGHLDVVALFGEKEINKTFTQLPAVLPTEIGTFNFSGNTNPTETTRIDVIISKPLRIAKGYAASMTIEPTSKTTSVATISLKNTNRQRGEDFINKLVKMYNRNTNNDKNEVAQKTEEFIKDRISIINLELGNTEQELETFKRDAGVTDLNTDAQIATTEKSQYEKRVVDNGTQLNLVQYLEGYLNDPTHSNEVLPANVGLIDNSLTELINQYNAMILERDRLLRSSSETNPVVTRLNSSIRDMHSNLVTSISSVKRGLLITKTDLNREASKYAGRINNAPTQERRLVSIQRQQEIKAGLYLMLLQKREENAIALAATTNNAKIVDDALADEQPVSPKSKMIYLIALVLGVTVPVSIIYLIGLMSFRIEGHQDVEKLTSVPIVGDVPFSGNKENKHAIVVHENDNDLMAETFRNLRTNILFMLGEEERKVILITSTTSGEGKTFIASNLAISLSLLGKRVVIVGLDIRKPGLNKVFRLSHKEKGITQFLSTPQDTNLLSLVQPSGITDNLFLLTGGIIPPNPTELLSRQSLPDAIDLLKREFDYVILDTAPIGVVTDTQIIARVADLSVYICRTDYTHKSDYQLINDIQEQKRLPLLCTVINGIDISKKKYGYYYGYGKYGKNYGYGKKYGYKYGHGYGHEDEK